MRARKRGAKARSRSHTLLLLTLCCLGASYLWVGLWVGAMLDSIAPIVEFCDVSVTNKGIYVKPGLQPPAGERKLYLLIEGDAERKVKMAASQVPRLPPPQTLAKDKVESACKCKSVRRLLAVLVWGAKPHACLCFSPVASCAVQEVAAGGHYGVHRKHPPSIRQVHCVRQLLPLG